MQILWLHILHQNAHKWGEQVQLLRVPSLRLLGSAHEDTDVLGIWNDRIYLDDACCFGRADRYQPATVSTISLKNGEESQPIDLYPDKAYHESQNLSRTFGQGGANYMIGKYLFVVVNREAVDPIVYRYDVTTLDKGFIRLRLSPLLDSAPLRSK